MQSGDTGYAHTHMAILPVTVLRNNHMAILILTLQIYMTILLSIIVISRV